MTMMFRALPLFEASKDGGNGGGTGNDPANTEQTNSETPVDFDAWLGSQPEDVKQLLETHTAGLKNALKAERESRTALERQLRDVAKKAEKGSEMEAQINQLADQMSEASRKANFYELAHAAGVKNLKLAYTVAVTDEMFDQRGNVNFEAMKQQYPELFGTAAKVPAGNAGSGAGGRQAGGLSMNDWIRQKAGRS